MMRWKGVVTQWLGYTYHEGSFNVVVCACAATIIACASRLAWRYTNDVELTLIVTMAVTATVGMQLVRIWVDNKVRDNLVQTFRPSIAANTSPGCSGSRSTQASRSPRVPGFVQDRRRIHPTIQPKIDRARSSWKRRKLSRTTRPICCTVLHNAVSGA